MPATFHRLKTRADRIEAEKAATLRQLILEFDGLPDAARSSIIAAVDRATVAKGNWPFMLIHPERQAAVARWLRENSKRPHVAIAVWHEALAATRGDTGEVMATRDELAVRVGVDPSDISRALSDLMKAGALETRRERVAGVRGPGVTRCFINPRIATSRTGHEREVAQAQAREVVDLLPAGADNVVPLGGARKRRSKAKPAPDPQPVG
jgi:DNA-binding transcriptional regulator YhcF (GntR family)